MNFIAIFFVTFGIFFIGLFGVFINRKNLLTIIICIELILLSINLNLVAQYEVFGIMIPIEVTEQIPLTLIIDNCFTLVDNFGHGLIDKDVYQAAAICSYIMVMNVRKKQL